MHSLKSKDAVEVPKRLGRNANGIGSLKETRGSRLGDSIIDSSPSGSRVSSDSSSGKSTGDSVGNLADSGYVSASLSTSSKGKLENLEGDSSTLVESGSGDGSELDVVLPYGVELVMSTTVEEADGGESEKNETGFSFRPSRDSGIFNAYRAKNGDYRGQGPRYKDPNLEYTHLWDAEAKCYVNNVSFCSTFLNFKVF